MQNHDVTGEEATTDAWTEVSEVGSSDVDEWIQVPPASERHDHESGTDRLVDTITAACVEKSQLLESSGGSKAGGDTAEVNSGTTSDRAQLSTTTSGGKPDKGTCQPDDPPARVPIDQVDQIRTLISEMSHDVDAVLDKVTTTRCVLADLRNEYMQGDGKFELDDICIACELSALDCSDGRLKYIQKCAEKQRWWVEKGRELVGIFVDEDQGTSQIEGGTNRDLESGKTFPVAQGGSLTGHTNKTSNDKTTTERTSGASGMERLSSKERQVSNIAEIVRRLGGRDSLVLPRILIECRCHGSHDQETDWARSCLLEFEEDYRKRHTNQDRGDDWLAHWLCESYRSLDELKDVCSAQEKAIANAYNTFVSREAQIFEEQQEKLYWEKVDAEQSRQASGRGSVNS